VLFGCISFFKGLTTFVTSAYHVDNRNQNLHPTEA